MIRCRLIDASEDKRGAPATSQGQAVMGKEILIGRAPVCQIHIPDPRVRLQHACIKRQPDGALYLEAAGPVSTSQGEIAAPVQLQLRPGLQFSIGPCDFNVDVMASEPATADVQDLTLHFSLRVDTNAPLDRLRREAAPGLRAGLVTRRRVAWTMTLVTACVLGLPFWTALQPAGNTTTEGLTTAAAWVQPQWSRLSAWLRGAAPSMDTLWNPGPLSSAHQAAAKECRACHERPFEHVNDESCRQCHASVGPHARTIAAAGSKETFGTQRCADCHREHQGRWGLKTVQNMGCVNCHGQIQTLLPESGQRNISDFGTDHPAFRLNVQKDRSSNSLTRVEQSPHLRIQTGLKFSHEQHLSTLGIKSPDGPAVTSGRVVMNCVDCHKASRIGGEFEPVRMATHCQNCHRLSVDPQVPAREVPHAAPSVVSVALREIYAALAIERTPIELVTVNSLVQRPQTHEPHAISLQASQFADNRASQTLIHMMEGTQGVCKTCHAITRKAHAQTTDTASWHISPVAKTSHWLPASRFSHDQHSSAKCETCHAARQSRNATEVLIPRIEVCQQCHSGPDPSAAAKNQMVASACESCHRFHQQVPHPSFGRTAAAARQDSAARP